MKLVYHNIWIVIAEILMLVVNMICYPYIAEGKNIAGNK